MLSREIDSSSKDLNKKHFLVDIDELNLEIRKKYPVARAIKQSDLDNSNKGSLFAAVIEKGKSFSAIVSEVYKIRCIGCRYDKDNLIKIEYYEK